MRAPRPDDDDEASGLRTALCDGHEAIIVEGAVEIEQPTEVMAARLSDQAFAKYPQYGRLDPSLYMAGVSILRPRRVLAWTSFTENATRFRFT